jgi:predicted DsbA family dithiol-disulfide isomerase
VSDLAVRTLAIDVWADVACPWCWIGDRRLDAALQRLRAEHPGLAVEHRWRPFQLQPGLPARGVPWAEFAREKFGGVDTMQAAFGHVAAAGASAGLDYRFDRMTVAPNTAAAHRLILHAGRAGDAAGADADPGMRELAMADRLFRAYFTEGAT